MERKGRSSYEVLHTGYTHTQVKREFRRCKNYDQVDKVIGVMSKKYNLALFAGIETNPGKIFNVVYDQTYQPSASGRNKYFGDYYPPYIKRAHAFSILKEMGVVRLQGKGKIRYRVTEFEDKTWLAITDRNEIIRSTHIHEDLSAWRVASMKVRGEDGIVKPQPEWRCIGCKMSEPFKLKGFMMFHTIGG